MAICPKCGSWVDEGDVCRNCGGVSGYRNEGYGSSSRYGQEVYSSKAWDAYHNHQYDLALYYIDTALLRNVLYAENWNKKAIILEAKGDFEESKKCYDEALSLERSNVYIDNKAYMMKNWAIQLFKEKKDLKKAIDLLNEAISEISSIPSEEDVDEYKKLLKTIQEKYRRRKLRFGYE